MSRAGLVSGFILVVVMFWAVFQAPAVETARTGLGSEETLSQAAERSLGADARLERLHPAATSLRTVRGERAHDCELDENDCNSNGVPDACDVDPSDPDGDGEVSSDCNSNGVPDECELTTGLPGMENAFRSPINGHLYVLTDPADWASAEAAAVSLGGHLATIRSAAENQWLLDTFASMTSATGVYIGFTDAAVEGQWVWVNGELVTYTNWGDGEPNGYTGSNCAGFLLRRSGSSQAGQWLDVSTSLSVPGIIEIPITVDCNANGILDECEIADGTAIDCDGNMIPDACDTDPSDPDGDGEVRDDCNANGIPDECDINPADPDGNGEVSDDCNTNGYPDECELVSGLPDWPEAYRSPINGHLYLLTSPKHWTAANAEAVALGGHLATIRSQEENQWLLDTFSPFVTQVGVHIGFTDMLVEGQWRWVSGDPVTFTNWGEGQPDGIGGEDNAMLVFNASGDYLPGDWIDIPDEISRQAIVEIPQPVDCNHNLVLDECDIASGTSADCNENGIPDECEVGGTDDCDSNGVMDLCDLFEGTHQDCDENGVPDVCQLATDDCNANLIPDQCEWNMRDCNANGVPDECDIDQADPDGNNEVSDDCNSNGEPDECEFLSAAPGMEDAIRCPINGHWYVLTAPMNWASAEAMAVVRGGHLATIRSAEENQWLLDTFAPLTTQEGGHIGATDEAVEGQWVWVSGEPFAFANWGEGEPNNSSNEDWAELIFEADSSLAPGDWNDTRSSLIRVGIVEVLDHTDCNDNGVLDDCDILSGTSTDCNLNNTPDECEFGGTEDCDSNGVMDICDVYSGTHADCDDNGVPDVCQLVDNDCNANGIPDHCEIDGNDCNANGVLDECDLDPTDPDGDGEVSNDCNATGAPDECEMTGASLDVIEQAILNPANGHYYILTPSSGNWRANEAYAVSLGGHLATIRSEEENQWLVDTFSALTSESQLYIGFTDEAAEGAWDWVSGAPVTYTNWASGEPNNNGGREHYTFLLLSSGEWNDHYVNGFGIVELTITNDCNTNGILDECDIAGGASTDCNANAIPDECEIGGMADCDSNGIVDLCDLYAGTHADCDENGVPDVCQLVDNDCNSNGIPDSCEAEGNDCDLDGILDECELEVEGADCNSNGIVDECELVSASYCLDFDGVDDFVSLPTIDWPGQEMTVEAWVFLRTRGSWARLIDFGNGRQSDNIICVLSNSSNRRPTLQVYNGSSGGATVVASSQLPLNEWVHVAYVVDGPEGRIYMNGVAVGAGSVDTITAVSRTKNFIGRSNWTSDAYADASVDEIRVWSVARSHAQILTDMYTQAITDAHGLEAYWPCENGDGQVLSDWSPNAWSGLLGGDSGIADSDPTWKEGGALPSTDCNTNGVLDECDLFGGASADCNENGIPDECEIGGTEDCDSNGIPDLCDLHIGIYSDCDEDGVPDVCQLVENDCNVNGVPDNCELEGNDCNANGILDECDIADGVSEDSNQNGIPDECEVCGDLDWDFDVDYADFELFRAAFGGVVDGVPPQDYYCDYDGSGAVGMADFGTWLQCYRDFIGDPLAGPPEPPQTPEPSLGTQDGPMRRRLPDSGVRQLPQEETGTHQLERVR